MSKEQIFEKAKELSDLIAHSDEKKAAQEASRRLMEDKEASELISGYNEKLNLPNTKTKSRPLRKSKR